MLFTTALLKRNRQLVVSIWDTCHSTAFTVVLYNLVVDPRFPRRGCQPQRWGHQPIILAKFSWKLHEIEKNGLGGTSLVAPCIRQWYCVNPSCRSFGVFVHKNYDNQLWLSDHPSLSLSSLSVHFDWMRRWWNRHYFLDPLTSVLCTCMHFRRFTCEFRQFFACAFSYQKW